MSTTPTPRQKEIATLRYSIEQCKTIIAREEGHLTEAVNNIEAGHLPLTSVAPAFYRADIDSGIAILEADKKRLAVLEAQEAAKVCKCGDPDCMAGLSAEKAQEVGR